MHMLKDERLAQHQPTQYPTSEVWRYMITLLVFLGQTFSKHLEGFFTLPVGPSVLSHTVPAQELQMAGINFKAFDLGGHEIARRVWKDYYAKVQSLIACIPLVTEQDANFRTSASSP